MNTFKNKIKKVSSPRKHTIKNCLGMIDAYKYYTKSNKPSIHTVNESIYRKIIDNVNLKMIDSLFETGELRLPLQMGFLRIYKRTSKPVIKNGELEYHAPINWNKTLELWEKDPESKIAKTLVKREPGDIYSIRYRHRYCKFKNKEYFMFRPSRPLKLKLKDRILSNKDSIPYYIKNKS